LVVRCGVQCAPDLYYIHWGFYFTLTYIDTLFAKLAQIKIAAIKAVVHLGLVVSSAHVAVPLSSKLRVHGHWVAQDDRVVMLGGLVNRARPSF